MVYLAPLLPFITDLLHFNPSLFTSSYRVVRFFAYDIIEFLLNEPIYEWNYLLDDLKSVPYKLITGGNYLLNVLKSVPDGLFAVVEDPSHQ